MYFRSSTQIVNVVEDEKFSILEMVLVTTLLARNLNRHTCSTAAALKRLIVPFAQHRHLCRSVLLCIMQHQWPWTPSLHSREKRLFFRVHVAGVQGPCPAAEGAGLSAAMGRAAAVTSASAILPAFAAIRPAQVRRVSIVQCSIHECVKACCLPLTTEPNTRVGQAHGSNEPW